MTASPIKAKRRLTDCPYCPDPREPCAECGRRAVAPAIPLAPPGFKIEDARQPYWDALADDMRRPCLEDKL